CMFALLLLTVEPPLTGLWRWCSGVAFVVLCSESLQQPVFAALMCESWKAPLPTSFFMYLLAWGQEPCCYSCITPPSSTHSGRSLLGSSYNSWALYFSSLG